MYICWQERGGRRVPTGTIMLHISEVSLQTPEGRNENIHDFLDSRRRMWDVVH